jgi:hypothetical protein
VQNAPPALASSPSVNEWWIVGAAAVLVLGACAFLIWRKSRRSAPDAEARPRGSATELGPPGPSSSSLLDALKEQMLELETGRLNGSISREEYDAAKRALEGTVKRALTRATNR